MMMYMNVGLRRMIIRVMVRLLIVCRVADGNGAI